MQSNGCFLYHPKTANKTLYNDTHLIPATAEQIRLNNTWQRQIKEEKERVRNAAMITAAADGPVEQQRTDTNDCGTIAQTIFQLENTDNPRLCSGASIAPVTMVTTSHIPTKEQVAQQFSLNKNQWAAFMIVASHLDTTDISVEGKDLTDNSDDKMNRNP